MNYKEVPIKEAKPLLKINQSYPIIVDYHYKYDARIGDSIIKYSGDITHVIMPIEEKEAPIVAWERTNDITEDRQIVTESSPPEVAVKPLSEITDDDCFELSKILKPQNDDDHHKAFGRSTLKGLFDSNMYTFDKAIKAYQFLQSRGYELPQYYPELSTPKCKVMTSDGWIDENGFFHYHDSPLNTNEEKEVELMDCECGHRVPHKFATFNGEHYTCMECHISWLEGLLAKADNTDEGIKELFDTHSAPYEDDDGNIQYALNIHDFRRALDLYKQSLSAKEKVSNPVKSHLTKLIHTTFEQDVSDDIDVHDDEPEAIEIWQGQAGMRSCVYIQKDRLNNFIETLKRFAGEGETSED